MIPNKETTQDYSKYITTLTSIFNLTCSKNAFLTLIALMKIDFSEKIKKCGLSLIYKKSFRNPPINSKKYLLTKINKLKLLSKSIKNNFKAYLPKLSPIFCPRTKSQNQRIPFKKRNQLQYHHEINLSLLKTSAVNLPASNSIQEKLYQQKEFSEFVNIKTTSSK